MKAPQEFNNQGCGQKLPDGSFGSKFNQNGGGTFVAEWDKTGRKMMRTWFFPKGQEPIDLVAKSPQPDMRPGWLGDERFISYEVGDAQLLLHPQRALVYGRPFQEHEDGLRHHLLRRLRLMTDAQP